MSPIRGFANPFYVVLIAAGTIFSLTAMAYTGMMVKGIHGVEPESGSPAGQWLHQLLDRHGVIILAIELSALAVFAVAAMATDTYWARRNVASQGHDALVQHPNHSAWESKRS